MVSSAERLKRLLVVAYCNAPPNMASCSTRATDLGCPLRATDSSYQRRGPSNCTPSQLPECVFNFVVLRLTGRSTRRTDWSRVTIPTIDCVFAKGYIAMKPILDPKKCQPNIFPTGLGLDDQQLTGGKLVLAIILMPVALLLFEVPFLLIDLVSNWRDRLWTLPKAKRPTRSEISFRGR